jgi:hypothetical protein
MDRRPPVAELIERREGPSRQGRGDEARTVGDQQAELLSLRGNVAADQQPVRSIGVVSDQDPVEAALLVGLGEVADIAAVEDDRAVGRMDLRLRPRLHHPDKLWSDELWRRWGHDHTVTFSSKLAFAAASVKQGNLRGPREFC